MALHFPLVDIRQEIDGTWEQLNTSESITVPLTGDYIVELIEVPDNGQVNGRVVISGLTETANYPPPAGYFFVNYNKGRIAFNPAQAGITFSADYWMKGSLVEAADINFLYTTVMSLSAGGGVPLPNIRTVTSDSSIIVNDAVVLADATSGPIVLSLFTVMATVGKTLTFKKIDSTDNFVTIEGYDTDEIDGDNTFDLELQHETITIVGDGTYWWII